MRRFFKITGIVAVNILFFLFLCLLLEFGFGMKCPSAAARVDASSFLETLLNPGKYNHLHYEVFNAGADAFPLPIVLSTLHSV